MIEHSRNTIKKAKRGEPWSYKERTHQPFPALDPYLTTVDGWLESCHRYGSHTIAGRDLSATTGYLNGFRKVQE